MVALACWGNGAIKGVGVGLLEALFCFALGQGSTAGWVAPEAAAENTARSERKMFVFWCFCQECPPGATTGQTGTEAVALGAAQARPAKRAPHLLAVAQGVLLGAVAVVAVQLWSLGCSGGLGLLVQ